jgi:hypothetical protein
MKLRKGLTLSLLGLFLMAVSAWANISTDYDHNINFAHYKTYSWGNVKTSNGLWEERVKSAVANQLAAKGWTEVPSGGDVMVSARDAIHNEQELNTFYDGFGGRRFGGLGTSTTTVENEKAGTLLIEMFDGNSKNLVWRSSATDTLSGNPEKNINLLDKNIEKMFQHFPPEPKK